MLSAVSAEKSGLEVTVPLKTPVDRLRFHLSERGFVNLARRARRLAGRFGVTASRMERALVAYVEISARYNVRPTLFVTAILLRRHPRIFHWLQGQNVELAIHGYYHTDHCRLSFEQQREHISKAVEEFRGLGTEPQGFRAPYFRWNRATTQAIAAAGLQYSSNRVAAWHPDLLNRIGPAARTAYGKALELYSAVSACDLPVLPDHLDGVLDIPVSIPDDEALVDRLGASSDEIAQAWQDILDKTYHRGEIFSLSLHHERVPVCAKALEAVIERARAMDPPVWIAPLREVAEWSRELARCRVEVAKPRDNTYQVRIHGPARVTALARGVKVINGPAASWHNRYQAVSASEFTVESAASPFVTVTPDSSPHLSSFLTGEGYILDPDGGKNGQGLQVRWTGEAITAKAKLELINCIEEASTSIVRIGRWPNGARSALAVSGDVDAMSLTDFALRLREP